MKPPQFTLKSYANIYQTHVHTSARRTATISATHRRARRLRVSTSGWGPAGAVRSALTVLLNSWLRIKTRGLPSFRTSEYLQELNLLNVQN